jgi:hypothetical protein
MMELSFCGGQRSSLEAGSDASMETAAVIPWWGATRAGEGYRYAELANDRGFHDFGVGA